MSEVVAWRPSPRQNDPLPTRRTMSPQRGRHRFATTRWTLVVQAGQRSAESERALSELCMAYWYPVYAVVRRKGYPGDQAEDLTQAFFARVLEKNYLRAAAPERGRFRSFLIASLQHFLSNERDWHRARKRDGGYPHVSLDLETADDRYRLEPFTSETPESLFERGWALAALGHAMARLEERQRAAGRGALFDRLKRVISGELTCSYADLARELGMSEGSLRVAVHRLRQEFGRVLRETIAETVAHPDDVDDELRHLLRTVSRGPG